MMTFLYLVPASLIIVTLLIVGWLRPRDREAVTFGAVAVAAGATLVALFKTGLELIVTQGAVRGHSVSVVAKERILAEGYGEAAPRLAAASVILVVALVGAAILLRKARTRLVVIGAACTLFIPIALFVRQKVGLHDRMVREAFADVHALSGDCFALTDAIAMAGGMDRAVQYDPDAHRFARQCVSDWITIVDQGGEGRSRLQNRISTACSMHAVKVVSPMELLATSNLLTDADQRNEVERRRKLADSSAP